MNIPAIVRQIYQEHLRSHHNTTRQERWQNLLDKAPEIKSSADHRGLQIAFDQLEREFSSTSPA